LKRLPWHHINNAHCEPATAATSASAAIAAAARPASANNNRKNLKDVLRDYEIVVGPWD
jgi:hypothetical protein